MVRAVLIALILGIASLALAQTAYAPKPGESVMKIAVEGRGDVYILLHTKKAPKTTAHIVGLVQRGFYNGQKFHRAIKDPRPFLIQFGDPATKSKPVDDKTEWEGGSGARVPFEDSGFGNVAGAVGLATFKDDRDSGDSQFYILLSASRFLNGSATVFGNVVSGMDVVRKVARGDKVTSVTILRG